MIKKIKNPLIEKSRFLIIPEPFEGEIFSSWFARCAYAHKTHPRTFWNLHFPKNKFIYSIINLTFIYKLYIIKLRGAITWHII